MTLAAPTSMLRALALACLCLALSQADSAQMVSVLHIKVVLEDAEGRAMPVPRHTLLVSDNPSTAAPRVIVTMLDGTADVKLRPGNYTVESENPVAFNGKAYQWTQLVDIVGGREAFIELTARNAEIVPVSPATTTSEAATTDPAFLLHQWQDSVVSVWAPSSRASAFVVDATGLIATNQRAIGTATAVEMQLTPAIKVEARVLAADPARDVAVLWVNPKILSPRRPVPLACGETTAALADAQEVFTIGVPFRREKDIESGSVSRVGSDVALADFRLDPGAAGGPVFTVDGQVVGLTSIVPDPDQNSAGDVRLVRTASVCAVLSTAQNKTKGATPPPETLLPVEPTRPFPLGALRDVVVRRSGSLNPYQISSSGFDMAFITPVHTYGAEYQAERARKRDRAETTRTGEIEQALARRPMDFGDWSSYVQDFPPVLLVHVMPRMAESFWTTVGRGAARTQGMAIPPIKRPKANFLRMRAFCGKAEVTPIHPLIIERRLSETNIITEGLYVFDPGALGPHCESVTLMLYSAKEPEKADTRVVDAGVVEQVWQDFAPYRASNH